MRYTPLAFLTAFVFVACETPTAVRPLIGSMDQPRFSEGQSGTGLSVSALVLGGCSAGSQHTVSGTITVSNDGDVATEGLTLAPRVQFKLRAGAFQDVPGATQAIVPADQIAPHASATYAFSITFTGVAGAVYRLASPVTITNHSGSLATPKGPEPKSGFPSGPFPACTGPGNVPPSLAITAPAAGSVLPQGSTVTFTGTASDPEDGDLASSIVWTSSLNGGLGTGGSVSSNSLAAGTHTITASVTDAGSLTSTVFITIRVNATPSLSITAPASGTTVTQGSQVTLNGSASDAEDGTLSASIAWSSSLGGALGTGASVSTSSLAAGSHTITASVTDTDGGTAQASITLIVSTPANTPPTVSITAPSSGSVFLQGANVTFGGTASDAQDGSLTGSIAWTSSLNGSLGAGGSVSSTTLLVGTHTITASVTDGGSLTSTASITIRINAAPSVTITAPASGSNFNSGTQVTFTGTASDTENGNISAAIAWSSSVDGSLGSGASVASSALSSGVHTITAAVTDSDGANASASITVTINAPAPVCSTPTPVGFTKTWSGTVSTDWVTSGNWSPAGVPALTDNVFVCASAASQPTLGVNATINDLRVESGATLTISSGIALTATGNVNAGNTITGAGALLMNGTSKTVQGTVSNLFVTGAVRAAAALNVTGNLVIVGPGSNLTVNGQQVTVTGDFTTNNNAVFTMTNAADLLVIGDDVHLNSLPTSTDGKLTAGEMRVGGDFRDDGNGSFVATGSHKVVLNGTAVQILDVNNPGPEATFFNLDITNSSGVVFNGVSHVSGNLNLLSPISVSGTGGFTVAGNLSTVAGSTVTVANVILQGGLGTTGVLGSFAPGTTRFHGSAQPIKAGLGYKNVFIAGTAHALGTTTMNGHLVVTGSGSNFTVNGQQVTITGDFVTNATAVFTMTNAADVLIVGGSTHFNSLPASTAGLLTAGELRVAGTFRDDGNGSFVATGSHKVVLNGTAVQNVTVTNPGPTATFFNLNITNTAGVTFTSSANVSGNLDLTGQMTVNNGTTITIAGTLFLRSTSVLNNNGVINKGACVKEAGATVNGTDPCP